MLTYLGILGRLLAGVWAVHGIVLLHLHGLHLLLDGVHAHQRAASLLIIIAHIVVLHIENILRDMIKKWVTSKKQFIAFRISFNREGLYENIGF